jgi:Flp pilus assembly protein TadB
MVHMETAEQRGTRKRQAMRYIVACMYLVAAVLVAWVAWHSGLTTEDVPSYLVAGMVVAMLGRGAYIAHHVE